MNKYTFITKINVSPKRKITVFSYILWYIVQFKQKLLDIIYYKLYGIEIL